MTAQNNDLQKQRMIEFLKANKACKEGFEFAIRECNSLTDCWNKAKPDWLIWLSTRENVLTDRELHEFMLASAESVKHLMRDRRSLDALAVKRRWLDGEATDEELREARKHAYDAYNCAYDDYDAAAAAAYVAYDYAADAADAASSAVSAAACAATSSTELEKQADWLRNNTKPNLL